MESHRDAYSVREIQDSFGLSRAFVYKLIKTGELPSVKLGKRRLVPATALTDLLASANSRASE